MENKASEAGIGQIFDGAYLEALYDKPGLPWEGGDPRTPDIIVQPHVGVIYTGSTKKQEEHGGFAQDDTNVMLLVSNPSLHERTITSFVETTQVAVRFLARRIGVLDPNGAGVLSYLLFESGYCRHLVDLGFSDGMARRSEILDFLGYEHSVDRKSSTPQRRRQAQGRDLPESETIPKRSAVQFMSPNTLGSGT